MSTGYERGLSRRRRLRREYIEGDDYAPPPRRFPLRTLLTLAMLVAGIWMAPSIVARTPLLNGFVQSAAANVNGSVVCRGGSLGWFSPVVLRGVELRDVHGESLVYIPHLRLETSLWKLLTSGAASVSGLRLEQPEVNIHLTDRGSDLQDALDPLWSGPGDTAITELDIAVNDGNVQITDDQTRRSWQVASLSGTCHWPSSRREPVKLSASGEVNTGEIRDEEDDDGRTVSRFRRLLTGEPGHERDHAEHDGPGSFTVDCTLPREFDNESEQSGTATIKAQAVPLALAEMLLRTYAPGTQVAGALSADVDYQWQSGPNGVAQQIGGQVETTNLSVTAPWLGEDRLRLGRVEMPCQIIWNDDRLDVQELSARCELGELTYKGSLDTRDGLRQALSNQPWELRGNVDLARLAATLPNTIRVREGTEITAGDVQLELASLNQDNQMVWRGKVQTDHLTALARGREVSWDNPVTLTFDAHDTPHGRVIDHLQCQSNFLELEAAGSREYLSVSSSFNLQKLADELDQFLDLSEVRLAGDGWSHMTWKQQPAGNFLADAEIQVRNLQIERPDSRSWTEDNLVVVLETTGRLDDEQQLERLEKAKLTVEGGERQLNRDELVAWLLKPVSEISREARWPVAIKGRGLIGRWLARLEPWLGRLIEGDIDGQIIVSAHGQFAPREARLEQADVQVRNLRGQVGPLFLDEPEASLTTIGQWIGKDRSLDLGKLSFKSRTINVEGRNVLAKLTEEGTPTLNGDLAFNGDLNRLAEWLHNPETGPARSQTRGRVSGKAQINRGERSTSAVVDAKIQDLVVEAPDQQPWREKEVSLVARGDYDRDQDRLKFSDLRLTSGAMTIDATGQLSDWAGRRMCDLSGNLEYDAEELAALVERYLGRGFSARGRQTQTFAIRGPLSSPRLVAGPGTSREAALAANERARWRDLTGEAAMGWETIDAYGFVAGPGELHGRLRDGVVRIDPLDLTLSGGRLRAQPSIQFSPGPARLIMPRGAGLERVQISPEMCANWLQYAAPVLAGVTRAEGEFSVQMADFEVPLSEPKTADIAGQLIVHDVEIGAGPLVEELATLLNRPEPARLNRESRVDLRMVGGKIYHRNLELVFSDFTIRTHGYVALDRTLAIMAEMPVPPKWIGNNRLGTAIRDQTIRLPIGGTLDRPRIDPQVLAQMSGQFLRNAAGRAVVNELNDQVQRQFDRLLDLPKPSGQ